MTTTLEIACTNQDVATLLRARTKDNAGAETGAFDETTRPTGDEVDAFITTATATIVARTGPVPEEYLAAAKHRVALQVELTYFPEQIGTDRSAFAEYKTMLDEDTAALIRTLTSSPAGQGAKAYSTMSRTPRTNLSTLEALEVDDPEPDA